VESYLDEFTFDPEAAQRIANVVRLNAMSMEDCANVLEAVAPYCTELTTQGFLYRLTTILLDERLIW